MDSRIPQAETPEEGRWEVTFSGGWVAPEGEGKDDGNVPPPKPVKPTAGISRLPSVRDQAYESPAVTTEERRKLKKEELLASLSAEVKLRRQQKMASQRSTEEKPISAPLPQDVHHPESCSEPSIVTADTPEISRNAPRLSDETYLISKPYQDDSLNTDVSAIMSCNDAESSVMNDPVTNLSPEQQHRLMEEANLVASNIRQSTETKMEELMLEFNDMLEKGEGIDNETMSIFSMTESTSEDQTSSQGSNKLASLESPTEPPARPRIVKPTDLKTNPTEEAPKAIRGRRKPLYPGACSSPKPVVSEERPTVSIRGGGTVHNNNNKIAGQANPKTQKQQQREGTVIKVQPMVKSNAPASSKSSSATSQSRSNTFTRPDSSSSNSESSPTPSPENQSKEEVVRPPGPVRQSTFTKDSPSDSEMNVPLISPSHNSPAHSPSKSTHSPSKSTSARLKTQSPSPSPAARGQSASARLHTATPVKKTEAKSSGNINNNISPTTSQSSSHIRPRTATPTGSSLNARNRSTSRASLASNSSVSTAASVRGSSSSIASGGGGSGATKKAASTSNLMAHRVSPRDKTNHAPQHQTARAKSASSGVLNNPKLSLSPRGKSATGGGVVKAEPAKGPSKKTAVVSKIASLWKKDKKTEAEEDGKRTGNPSVESLGAESSMTKSSTYEKLSQQLSPDRNNGSGNHADKKKQGTFTKDEASKMKAEAASGFSSIGGWAKKKAEKSALQKGGKGNGNNNSNNPKSSFYVTLEESSAAATAQNEEPPKKSPSASNGSSSDGASEALQDIWVKRVHTAINLNDCEENNSRPDDHSYPQSSQESDAVSVKSSSRSGTKTPTLERLNSFVKLDNSWSSMSENNGKKGDYHQSKASSRATSPQPITQAPPGRTSSMATLSSFGSKSRTSSTSLQRSPTSESIMAAASTAVQIVTPFNWNLPSGAGVNGGDDQGAEGASGDATSAGARGAEGSKKSTCLITTV